VLAVAVVGWWASEQGYFALSASCTDEGYSKPLPSFEQLVNEYAKSPYCARLVRGETWSWPP
jgi:hypothetical protein